MVNECRLGGARQQNLEEQRARHEDDHDPGNCVSDEDEVPQSAAGSPVLLNDAAIIRRNIHRCVGNTDEFRVGLLKWRDH